MPRAKKTDEFTVQAAAYLAADGMRQEQIGKILRLSQAAVSRALREARHRGWLKTTIRFAEEDLPPGRLAEIVARVFPRDLQDAVKKLAAESGLPPPEVRVLPSVGAAVEDLGLRQALAQFGHVAAGHVHALMARSRIVGVTWGRTVASVVQGFRELPVAPPKPGNRIRVVPLCGEPLGRHVPQLSSSSLAAQLAEIVAGKAEESLSIALVPYLIPVRFEMDEVTTIRKLIEHVDAYTKIFVGDDESTPLVREIDTVITSVGPAEAALGYGDVDAVKMAGIDRARLEKLVVGDVGGALIPRTDLDDTGTEELKKIEERWMGLRLDHVYDCARNAKARETAGVIVVAVGAKRTEIVREGVRLGLINHLIIDQALATGLAKNERESPGAGPQG